MNSYKIQNISQLFQYQEYHLRPRSQSLARTEKMQGIRKEGYFIVVLNYHENKITQTLPNS
jgi:hypothetical protein